MAESQDTPDPDTAKIPSAKLRGFFRNLINWAAGMKPLAGTGIRIDEYPGTGTMISVNPNSGVLQGITPGLTFSTIDLDVCIDGSPETKTFVILE